MEATDENQINRIVFSDDVQNAIEQVFIIINGGVVWLCDTLKQI